MIFTAGLIQGKGGRIHSCYRAIMLRIYFIILFILYCLFLADNFFFSVVYVCDTVQFDSCAT